MSREFPLLIRAVSIRSMGVCSMTSALPVRASSRSADCAMKVTAIDSTADNVDVLTVDALASGIKATDVIAEATSEKKVKVVPNALTPYDTCVDEDSFACDGDAAWAVYDTPVLERRIPVLPAVIKTALKEAGRFFRFSNRK